MKVSDTLVLILVSLEASQAFQRGVFMSKFQVSTRDASKKNRLRTLQMAPTDEIEALRAKAAQLRKEADEAAKAMGKELPNERPATSSSSSKVVQTKKVTVDEVMSKLSSVNFDSAQRDTDALSQISKLDELTKSGDLSLWKAAVTGSANTGSPAPLRTYPVSLEFMSSRTNGLITGDTLGVGSENEVTLDDFKDATIAVVLGCSIGGVASLAFLPENVGATLCYFFALTPILFIGVGSSAPGVIAGAIAQFKGTADDKVKRERRVCAHEAGHFLCGYLCGLPVKGYSITDEGYPCVEFHSSSDADAITARREFTSEEIAALSVVALSGSVAEILSFGQAKGGENDLLELDNLLRRSKEFVGAQKQQDLTRWGALTSYNLIKSNMQKYEKLVDAFQSRKSVAECIAVLEATE